MASTTEQWDAPSLVDDATVAFPASVVDTLMPSREDCEAGLDALPDKGAAWRAFQNQWFMRGLPDGFTVTLREGIDGEAAFRHLAAIQGSFEPRHEHKVAAVAYLASRWFVAYNPPKSEAA